MPSTYPAHTVYLDEYKIDKYMVTYNRYNKCIEAGVCTNLFPAGGCNGGMPWNANHPVNCVDYNQAKTFCEWEGKRLPTEAEWEKAARGTDGRKFPWGDEKPNCDLAVMNDQPFVEGVMGPGCGNGYTQPVGSRPNGASPYGAMDMVGNLWEWTQDWFAEDYFENSPYKNPQGPATGDFKVLKGSGWTMRTAPELLANIRFNYAPLGQGYVIGFRCAKSTDKTTSTRDKLKLPTLKVFPNPTTGMVTVEGKNISKIIISNIQGKTVWTILEHNDKHSINLSNLSSGTYFIKVYSKDFFVNEKIILQ
jgi:iron(II)-dependent oxidoreductase